jgi:AraC-like DNA-binding protein
MKEACRLLSDDREHKVKDISEALGFQNQQYFSHAFRAFSGYTPLEYKEKITEQFRNSHVFWSVPFLQSADGSQ